MARRYYRKTLVLSTGQIFGLLIGGFVILGVIYLREMIGIESVEGVLISIVFLGVIVLGGIAWGIWTVEKRKREKLRALKMSNIDEMGGVEFERYVGYLLSQQGFSSKYTSVSGDYGVDIVAQRGEEKWAIQVKRYTGLVGREAISDAIAGVAHYRCNKAMVVTNSHFTPAAKTLAASNNCVLVDRDKLAEWMVEVNKRGK